MLVEQGRPGLRGSGSISARRATGVRGAARRTRPCTGAQWLNRRGADRALRLPRRLRRLLHRLSISSPIPGMPQGKPAGVRCVQLTATTAAPSSAIPAARRSAAACPACRNVRRQHGRALANIARLGRDLPRCVSGVRGAVRLPAAARSRLPLASRSRHRPGLRVCLLRHRLQARRARGHQRRRPDPAVAGQALRLPAATPPSSAQRVHWSRCAPTRKFRLKQMRRSCTSAWSPAASTSTAPRPTTPEE